MTAGTTTVVTSGNFDEKYGKGTILEIESERMMVISYATPNATVLRGVFGTTAVGHTAPVDIYIDPRLDSIRTDILDLFNNCLVDMYPMVYVASSQTFTYNASVIGYELDAAANEVFAVTGRVGDATDKNYGVLRSWKKMTGQDTGVFTSGKAIMLHTAMPNGAPFRAHYEAQFTKLTDESDDLEADAGLRPYMVDLPYYFALSRLMVTEEQERSDTGTAVAHQRAADVPAFLALRTGDWYAARYSDLLENCRATLWRENDRSMGAGY